MRKTFLLILLIILVTFSVNAQSLKLSGTVKNAENGDVFANATIELAPGQFRVKTNEFGSYEIKGLSPLNYTIVSTTLAMNNTLLFLTSNQI